MVLLIFIGALFAHISVNTLNEYFDFKSGLDLTANKTPFSGGSGALPNTPDVAGVSFKGWLAIAIDYSHRRRLPYYGTRPANSTDWPCRCDVNYHLHAVDNHPAT
jgi:hypothetical protein